MQHLDKPREIPIHQSANRPHLILGGDRELVLFAGLTAACLAFTLASVMGILLGLVVWFVSVAVLSRMGKADPMLRHVYLRSPISIVLFRKESCALPVFGHTQELEVSECNSSSIVSNPRV
jgi:type IV secretory pathway TrbD component